MIKLSIRFLIIFSLNYLNLMLQKATELGITKFIPILTDRTIVRKLNYKRMNKIIIEASEQSNRLNVPEFHEIIKFDEFIKEYLNLFIELFFYKNINNSKNISFKIKKYFYLKLSFVKKYNLDFESFFLEFNDKLLSE